MRNYIEFGIEYESCQEEIGRHTSAPDGHWALSRGASAEAETSHGASVLIVKGAHGMFGESDSIAYDLCLQV
jgi:hypothetical protein